MKRKRALVEHLIIAGAAALVALLAFNHFSRALHPPLREAELSQGEGMPAAADLLGAVGGPNPNDYPSGQARAEAPGGAQPTRSTPTKQLQCGDVGSYGDLKDKKPPSGAELDRDHVPSKAALLKRAEMLLFGEPLSREQRKALEPEFGQLAKAIQNGGLAIAIPREAHRSHSETYGGRNNADQQEADAKNMPGAAARDLAAIQTGLALSSPGCQGAYAGAAKRILGMSQADHDRHIRKSIYSLSQDVLEALSDKYQSPSFPK